METIFQPRLGIHSFGAEQEESDVAILEKVVEEHHIVVWNDEVNTFDWVIISLMEICEHTEEQAEQCAYIIHFSGKYAVKKGKYEALKPMCEALLERGINANIS